MMSEPELNLKYSETILFLKKEFGLELPNKLAAIHKRKFNSVMENGRNRQKNSNSLKFTNSPSDENLLATINLFTNNHTSFLRSPKQFKFLKQYAIPSIINESSKSIPFKLRIWSAAAASGEEPYSILLTIFDDVQKAKYNVDILATDINTEALKKGFDGVYKKNKIIRELGPYYNNYFTDADDESSQFGENLRSRIDFRWLNLNSNLYPVNARFHIIFCRNVLYYLCEKRRSVIIKNLVSCLYPGGYLFLGLSETSMVDCPEIVSVNPGIYKKVT